MDESYPNGKEIEMMLAKEFEGELWVKATDVQQLQSQITAMTKDMDSLEKQLEMADAAIERWKTENEELRGQLMSMAMEMTPLKAQSTEPFGYWHQGETYEESEFFLASESGDVRCDDCVVLYSTPPTATALVEDFKRRAVEELTELKQYNNKHGRFDEAYGCEECIEAIESLPLVEGEGK